jgi:4-hydroxybenzoate polyprenyltransferase
VKTSVNPDSEDRSMTDAHESIAGTSRAYSRQRLGFMTGLLLSLRPHQWVKNTLVLAGLFFSRSLLDRHAVLLTLAACAIFCAASSGVYLFNDLRDLPEDRNHPAKRLRPIAAGSVSPAVAAVFSFLLIVTSGVAAVALQPAFGGVVLAFITLNLAYSMGLRRIVIVDILVVASGFVLRAVAGAVVIGVHASPWLILCTLQLALLVAVGKRRQELVLLERRAAGHRISLEEYSVQFLDLMMGVSGAAAMVTYALYTMADDTVAHFGSRNLVLTVPFVLYGLFRYCYLVQQRREGGDPARLFVSDRPLLINVLLWILAVAFFVYWTPSWLSL